MQVNGYLFNYLNFNSNQPRVNIKEPILPLISILFLLSSLSVCKLQVQLLYINPRVQKVQKIRWAGGGGSFEKKKTLVSRVLSIHRMKRIKKLN